MVDAGEVSLFRFRYKLLNRGSLSAWGTAWLRDTHLMGLDLIPTHKELCDSRVTKRSWVQFCQYGVFVIGGTGPPVLCGTAAYKLNLDEP